MFPVFYFAFLVLVLFATAIAKIELDGNVLVLNGNNFDEAVSAGDVLVEFYAPWCGHCKSLAPEWAKAAKTLENSPIKLAKVDATATESKSLAEKEGIKGFPTIKFFRGGKSSEYSGGRTESEIVKWVNKKAGPSIKTITTDQELADLREANNAFIIGVFDSADSAVAKAFSAAANADDNNVYAFTTSEAVRTSLGVTGNTAVVLKSFDDKRNDLPLADGFDVDELNTFVLGSTTPLIQEFSQEASKKIFSSPITKHALIFTKKTSPHHASTLAAVTTVANTYKGKLLFVTVPHTENRILDFFGIKEQDLPKIVVADMGGGAGIKKYPFTGSADSAEAFSAFLADFTQGTLKPHLKSEEPAPEDTTGPVTVLRGSSFSDLVINNSKDVFVEFYAPWCGHCKSLAPIWEQLGNKFSKVEGVTIAKMDATANEIDVDGVAVQGFPTLFFFKGDDKTHPLKYEGARELDDLLDYVKDHASSKFNHDEL